MEEALGASNVALISFSTCSGRLHGPGEKLMALTSAGGVKDPSRTGWTVVVGVDWHIVVIVVV